MNADHGDEDDAAEDLGHDEPDQAKAGGGDMSLEDMGPEVSAGDWEPELSGLPVPEGPPVEQVIARGRALRHRRRARVSQATAGTVIGLSLAAALGGGVLSAANGGPKAKTTNAALAAFSVTTNSDGTVSLTLRRALPVGTRQALAQALSKAGVPAVVKVGTYCVTPVPSRLNVGQVISLGAGTAVPASATVTSTGATVTSTGATISTDGASASGTAEAVSTGQPTGQTVIIHRSAMPAGSNLMISYLNGGKVAMTLVPAGSQFTCSAVPPTCWTTAGGKVYPVPLTPAGQIPIGTLAPVAEGSGSSPASTAPASTLPATTLPGSTLPASTLPASTLPASTIPAPTGPATTGPATAGPATTWSASNVSPVTGPLPVYWRTCPLQVRIATPAVAGTGPATTGTGVTAPTRG